MSYSCLVFDCDGVVLDSNSVKTEAFRTAGLPYGTAAAEALVAWHVARGGISRYEKFRHFLAEIVPVHAPGTEGPGLEALLADYAAAVRAGLMSCRITPGLAELRVATQASTWMIVSGGDQAELREIFAARGLDGLFDGGIFGSPDSKDAILARELTVGRLPVPALFLGDSCYDHEAARRAGMDFVFVSDWSEMPDWQAYLAREGLRAIPRVATLLDA